MFARAIGARIASGSRRRNRRSRKRSTVKRCKACGRRLGDQIPFRLLLALLSSLAIAGTFTL